MARAATDPRSMLETELNLARLLVQSAQPHTPFRLSLNQRSDVRRGRYALDDLKLNGWLDEQRAATLAELLDRALSATT